MELKEDYASIKEAEIQKDWQIKTIESCCSLINGRGFKPFEWKKEGLPIIRIQNLNGSDEFNYYHGPYDKKIEVEPGELLFAWSGSRGTSFGPHIWKGEKGLLNYHTWKVVISEAEIDKKYFFHALKVLTKEIENSAHGASALVHTQKWVMEKMEFASPSKLDEQTAIATALSDMDALIDQTEKLIEKKIAIKQGMIQQLLSPYDEEGKLKEGWSKKTLGEAAEIVGGGTPSTTNLSYWNGHISWFTPTEVGYSKYLFESVRKITSEGLRNSSAKLLPVGTILFTSRASIGEVAILENEGCTNQGFQSLIAKNSTCSEFLYYLLFNMKSVFFQVATGSTFLEISPGKLRSIEVIVPNKQKQLEIANILSEVDIELEANKKRLKKQKFLKQSMMQSLLTGKIRIYNPNYEPATQV